jgi:hypothetical protein
MAENSVWHACCIMNGMTGQKAGQPDPRSQTMNIKTNLFSAVAALLISGLAVGTAIAPAGVAIAAPVKIAFYA